MTFGGKKSNRSAAVLLHSVRCTSCRVAAAALLAAVAVVANAATMHTAVRKQGRKMLSHRLSEVTGT
jgi:hypothetical protein